MLPVKEIVGDIDNRARERRALPILLAILAHFPVVAGLNLGMGVHVQANPLAGALLVLGGWCVWLYAFHLCVRGKWKRQRGALIAILSVPIALAAFGALTESTYGEFNVFYLYLLVELILLAGACIVVSRGGTST